MTQLVNDPNNISNHFDRVFDGIGHRGSSFTNIDGLVHNGQAHRFLMLEFKHSGELVSGGQQWAMRDFAKMPDCAAWIVWLTPCEGEYLLQEFPSEFAKEISLQALRKKFQEWWG